jgi:hypothetical protein
MKQLGLEFGKKLRDEGIKRTENTAGRKWLDEAYKYVELFIQPLPRFRRFKTEQVREFAKSQGIVERGSSRVWGSLILRAVKAKLIMKSGISPVENPNAHRAFSAVWMKL